MKTLEEVKDVLETDKVFETKTAFGVNLFGKYLPNITFIIPKEFEDNNPIRYRDDEPTKSMIANMNIDFGGDAEVLFGDFWKSQKGNPCFRPKPIEEAKHVLIKVGWGGAFDRSRGLRGREVEGCLYYRRASSNGGGMGNDYLVVPVGFRRIIYDPEIDGDETPPAAEDFEENARSVREMIMEYDREQARQAEAVELESKLAKEAGLGARLEAVNQRLRVIGVELVEIGESRFTWGWRKNELYTEADVSNIENRVGQLETEAEQKELQRQAHEEFQPKFEEFRPRVEALGFSLILGGESPYMLDGSRRTKSVFFEYSSEGLEQFIQHLKKLEAGQ